jgi:hypothetical protein
MNLPGVCFMNLLLCQPLSLKGYSKLLTICCKGQAISNPSLMSEHLAK